MESFGCSHPDQDLLDVVDGLAMSDDLTGEVDIRSMIKGILSFTHGNPALERELLNALKNLQGHATYFLNVHGEEMQKAAGLDNSGNKIDDGGDEEVGNGIKFLYDLLQSSAA